MKKRSLALVFALIASISIYAQVDHEFWFAIPKETGQHGCISSGSPCTAENNVSFKITAQSVDDTVIISMPANPAFTPIKVFVPANTTKVVEVANSFATFQNIYANSALVNNKPIEGTTNRAIHITSTAEATVYYDYNNYYNRDLWSLKGSNGLGTEFYTPFQNIWANGNATNPSNNATNYGATPYSDAEIVATVDNTTVQITLPPGVASQTHAAGSTFSITLNKGQTYSLVAAGEWPAAHMTGTHIVSTDPNKPIAVIINDDTDGIPGQTCYDVNGDQLVPTTIIGSKYVVMTGVSATQDNTAVTRDPKRGEQVTVVATQPNTTIKFYDRVGNLKQTSVLNAQGSDYFSPNTADALQDAIYITASSPIYAYHITGVGCETGGALLPPITDCTGSQSVTFFRSSSVSVLTLNLMIPYDKTMAFTAASQPFNFFKITYQNGTSQPIPGSWFEAVDSAGWAVLKYGNRNMSTTLIPNDQAVTISNSNTDYKFHLGITNGTGGVTDKYGYFSSYNAAKASTYIAQSGAWEDTYVSCFGLPVVLVAKDGLSYQWHYGSPTGPPTYLSDPSSATPTVYCPPGDHYFYVTVHQPKCFGDVTLSPLHVKVLPAVTAAFETDKTAGCSPMSILFTNTTEGANTYEWSKKIDNGAEIVFVPSNPLSFTESPLVNKTAPYAPKNYYYKLKASINGACKDTATKIITVYPEIKASFLPNDTTGCAPMLVNFRNLSSGNVTDSSYYWNFGDQNTSVIKVPTHQFNNYFTIKDTTYNVQMVATSPYICRDTMNKKVTVHPFIKAGFTVDTVKGCSPFFIKIYNNSQNRKAIGKYFWDFNYKNPAVAPRDTLTTGDKDTLYHTFPRNLTNAPISYKILLTVSHNFGTGCPDTISRTVTVYPEGKVNILNADTAACNPLTINFTVAADAGVSQYIWDFNDGSTSNQQNPSHQFVNLTNADITYKVSVRTYSPQYCGGYDTMKVTVHASIDPQFAIDASAICAPYGATFTNKSVGGITSYTWDFGDGNWGTSSASSFTHMYRNTLTTPVTRTAKLVVQNSGGCKDSVSHDITLYPEVHAQFTSTAGSYCSPRKVDFVNQSNSVATRFIWKFGDKITSLAYDTTHYYVNNTSTDTVYSAYLVAMSDYNCIDSTAATPFLVYPYINPYFALDTTAGCSPLTVKISNGSTGPYTSESWDFNDGNPASPAQPKIFSHVFTNTYLNRPQTFVITLRINYKGICQKPFAKTVSVNPTFKPLISPSTLAVCNNSVISFKDSSNRPPAAPLYSYEWNFGDGASAAGTYPANTSQIVYTTHKFENLSTVSTPLTVTFKGLTQKFCESDTSFRIIVYPQVIASFTFDDAAGCSPLQVPLKNASSPTATWVRFWDDATNPSSGYPVNSLPNNVTFLNNTDTVNKTFKPKLKVAYLYNGNPVCADSITQTVVVYPQVTAYFAAKDSFKICHPDSVHFSNGSRLGNYALSSTNTKLTYKWLFGDNGSSSGYEPSHLYYNYDYSNSLVDTVTLTATSQYNCLSTLKKLVTIYPKPKAIFDVANSIACPPFPVQIDHSSIAETGSLFTWKFNDGGPDTITRKPDEIFGHTFNNRTQGTLTYPIQLTATTPHNCTSSTSQDINVYPGVIADFDKDTAGCNPLIVGFVDKSQQADSWYWDFGDNTNSKTESPQHTFFNYSLNDTTYTVKLSATSKFLCHHDTTRKVTVYPQPVANFEADRYYFTYSPTNNIVAFTNQTNPGNWNYSWNFDDQTPLVTSYGPVLYHDYQPHWDGRYNVLLKVWSNHCQDSISHRITIVAPKPIADFRTSENGCVPLTVSFTELTDYGTSWNWDFGDGGTFDGQNPPPYTYYTAGKYNVKLTVTGNGGTSYAFRDVEVYPKPTVDFDLKPNLVMLSEKMEAPVQFYNKCQLGTKFLWDFGDSTKSEEKAPLHIYKSIGYYTVKLGAWTVNQCYDEIIKKDTVHIVEQHEIQFPNAFKPIYGMNDGTYNTPDTRDNVFHPSWTGVVEYHLEIYDRWGEKLFESDDINVGWNGYYKGKLCKTDVYIWKAKGKYTDGGTFEKAGNVTLLR